MQLINVFFVWSHRVRACVWTKPKTHEEKRCAINYFICCFLSICNVCHLVFVLRNRCGNKNLDDDDLLSDAVKCNFDHINYQFSQKKTMFFLVS